MELRALLLPATATKKDALLHNHIITFNMPQKSDTKIVMTVVNFTAQSFTNFWVLLYLSFTKVLFNQSNMARAVISVTHLRVDNS